MQYILCVDRRWGFNPDVPMWPIGGFGERHVVENTGRRCYVDAVNAAAKAASGANPSIVIADDQFACDKVG